MRSGDLRHRIDLQSITSTPDAMGGTTDSWADEATDIPAAIWPISANEQIRAASPLMVATHRIRIRYYSGLSAAWRVVFGARYFSIVSVINHEERNVQMDLLCKETVT